MARVSRRRVPAVVACAASVLLCHPALSQTTEDAPKVDILPTPSLNFYGVSGLMDMPSAEHQPDGQFSTSLSYFGGVGRYNMTFQAFPWLSATFRYSGTRNLNLFGFDTYWDRGFDVRFRLLKETEYLPTVTLGFQDFVGTGVYSAEYLVATKNFETPPLGGARPGNLKVTAGLGWGRFGSYGSIGSPFGENRPVFDGGTGGELATESWFRGPMSPFAGIEYKPNDKYSFKLEYSTDAYVLETEDSDVFERKSQINFGVEYQVSRATRLGAYYMYGSSIGVSAQIQLNPYQAVTPMQIPAPRSVWIRPPEASNPSAWTTSWTESESARTTIRTNLDTILREDGLVLESLTISAHAAEVRYRNLRYMAEANAVGRVARAMARTLPASVETFRIVPMSDGLALSAVTVRRSDLEALEFAPGASAGLEAVLGYGNAPPLDDGAIIPPELYPDFSWILEPYYSPSYFDPSKPFRIDVGLELGGTYRPAPGWIVSGAIRQRLFGNVADGRSSNSVLPRVRTDANLYAEEATTLNRLYVARQWSPGKDLYARATFGYLESMFGGLSGEVLWQPVTSPLALGVELNYAQQRDFDQRFGFQDYNVVTGHASAYYDFGRGYIGQIDVGRYLAGDVGATFSMDRTFDNGWSVGAFFTLTDVSAEDFGEGSFDKGIRFSMPVGYFLGKPTKRSIGTTIRPIQRDGGARLNVPGRLYPQVRAANRAALSGQAARLWE